MDKEYWNSRWQKNETGWDIGYASPAITAYFDNLQDRSVSILIPGCGNAYEAEYLHQQGFENVTVVDISEAAVQSFTDRVPTFNKGKVLCEDFFGLTGQYDYIIEQTFFCALEPNLRSQYVEKCHELLKPSGHLVGLMFQVQFSHDGPPFGGDIMEYKTLFEPMFNIEKMETSRNSIPPRSGSEVFISLTKK